MCGIMGYTGNLDAAPILLDGLKKLEYRGYDSAGIAVMNGNKISISKVSGRTSNLCEKTDNGKKIFRTRRNWSYQMSYTWSTSRYECTSAYQ